MAMDKRREEGHSSNHYRPDVLFQKCNWRVICEFISAFLHGEDYQK